MRVTARRGLSCHAFLSQTLISSPSSKTMSSPPQTPMSPPQDFWTDDVDMQDGEDGAHADQPASDAPAAEPLFLASTPSVAGTPARRRNIATPGSRTSEVARRAVGLSTPRGKTPLFAGESALVCMAMRDLTRYQLQARLLWPFQALQRNKGPQFASLCLP